MARSKSPSGGDSKSTRKKKTRKGEQLFCICREPEDNRFMIGCDECDEWYHGDCVSITRAVGKQIGVYFCAACKAKNPSLETTYKNAVTTNSNSADLPKRCTECRNCLKQPDCGECDNCTKKRGRCLKVQCNTEALIAKAKKKAEKELVTEKKKAEKAAKKPPARRRSIDTDEYDAPSPMEGTSKQPPRGRKKGWKKDQTEEASAKRGRELQKMRPGYETKLGDRLRKGAKAYQEMSSPSVSPVKQKIGPVQCHANGCTHQARAESKYCSDKCGLALAKERLMLHLPKNLENYWRIEPVALRDAREEEMRRKEEEARLNKEMVKLDAWYDMAIKFINAIKGLKPDDQDDDRRDEADMWISCPVCTTEYTCRTIPKHLEKCFAKQEKQSTYGTNNKYAINPSNIFCEEFNKSNNTYCKRLRVICPEHYKGDIEAGLEICGWPKAWSQPGPFTMERLFTSVEEIISMGTCGISRKDCKQHCGWIPSILGMIDNARMAHFTRMDELIDSVKVKRGDAILLMCNTTEYHQPLEKILESYEKGKKKAGDKMIGTVL